MRKIGLIGGLSWVSTVDYYRFINEGVHAKLGGLHFAECLLYSLDFGELQAKGWDEAFDLLFSACDSVKRGGVEAIALCANTPHLYADELQNKVGLPLIHIGVATAQAVRQRGLKKVGLLGTKITMERAFYSDKLRASGVDVLVPQHQETRDFMQTTLRDELGLGILKETTKDRYISIAQELIERGAEGIIFGCTEIPLLLNQSHFAVPVFDTTRIHAQAIVDYMVS